MGTPYAWCFQWVVHTIQRSLFNLRAPEKVAFFHEQSDYQSEALETYSWIRDGRDPGGHLGPMAFGRKDEYVPLQAADVLAYETFLRLGDMRRKERLSLGALDASQSLSIKFYDRENLPELIERLERSYQEENGSRP